MENIYIGCSGYSYHHWQNGKFYPPKTPDLLSYYAGHFNALEINSSFYNIPKPDSVATWASKMRTGSKLILKAPKSFTHSRQLMLHSTNPEVRDGIELLSYFCDGIAKIPPSKRGPILVQIAERSSVNLLPRIGPLAEFLKGRNLDLALEVRNKSWLTHAVFKELEKYGVALVASDRFTETNPTDTADFVYIRRHGPPHARNYAGSYSDEEIHRDAELVRNWARLGKTVYVFYNNDIGANAPRNAAKLMQYLNVKVTERVQESVLRQLLNIEN